MPEKEQRTDKKPRKRIFTAANGTQYSAIYDNIDTLTLHRHYDNGKLKLVESFDVFSYMDTPHGLEQDVRASLESFETMLDNNNTEREKRRLMKKNLVANFFGDDKEKP